ncbi:MAG: putative 4-hydroxybenzoate polyprenyltransferase [Treponema sp.]|jgi:4-hydroxybenzoate polyprenyltransferase|nr:putative 4-hydroxybenzoate polyprenyltransferase [Treponema sp.]
MGFKNTAKNLSAKIEHKLRNIGDAVIFRHTLFSLPFAIVALLIESDGQPPIRKIIFIILAAVAGRNAANALNRVIDAEIDAKNPRTANRHLPSKILSKKTLLVFTAVMGIILVVSAAMLNLLCVMLLPVAAMLIGGYSYTKRFTWLCHYWLGVACAIAPMGTFIALSGRFEFRYFVLAGAHALWVAGFDILYALQDIDFDRSEKLQSIPARFGSKIARIIAILSHAGAVLCLAALPLFWNLSWFYLAGIALSSMLLISEHVIALGNSERHIRIASYSINEIIPLMVLLGTVLDIYIPVQCRFNIHQFFI